ncbi:MAG: hypothetical protein JSV49_08635 [Thermoplasmata archaeon]|nr:MAG: hypothetical protein JSV49_08635 [Thermoplasmata archaeon]
MRGKVFSILITAVIILPLFFLLSVTESEAVGAPVVTLRFVEGEEEQVADVRPGEHGTVVFPGTIEVRLPAGSSVQNVLVELTGSTGMNWPTSMNPTEVWVIPGTVETFTATIAVPPETSYYVQDTVTVSGTATPDPGATTYNVEPITGTIRIEQFYKFSLSSDKPSEEACVDSIVYLQLIIHNQGNGRDTFSISLQNQQELDDKDINVILGTTTIEVDEKSRRTVSISATPLNPKSIGTHEVIFEVKSDQQESIEGTAFPQTYAITLKVTEAVNGNGDYNFNNTIDDSDRPSEKDVETSPGFEGIILVSGIAIAIMISILRRKRLT